jgi:hypothetical protein
MVIVYVYSLYVSQSAFEFLIPEKSMKIRFVIYHPMRRELLYKTAHVVLQFKWITKFSKDLFFPKRRIGCFTIFCFTRFEPSDTCAFIGVSSSVFLSDQNIQIAFLKFLCLGYPPGIEKYFFSFPYTFPI